MRISFIIINTVHSAKTDDVNTMSQLRITKMDSNLKLWDCEKKARRYCSVFQI